MGATQAGAVRFARINISTATTTTLVAAVAGKCINVLHASFSLTGTTPTALFQDNAGSPNLLTGAFDSAGVYDFAGTRDVPLFATAKGQRLDVVSTGTPSMRGFIAYTLED